MGEIDLRRTYDENPDFNLSIDEESKPLSIFGATFLASRVLFEMEPEIYRQALLDFKEQETDRLKNDIMTKFPTPIAFYFQRFEQGSQNANQRLLILRDVWESLIRFLFAVVVSEFICSCNISMSEVKISRDYLLSDKLNNKLVVIKKLIELATIKGLTFSFMSIVTSDIVNRLEELNKVRNLFSHTSALTEEQSRQMIIDNYDDVLLVLQQLEKLSDVVLMRYVGQPSPYVIRYELFEGYPINRVIKEMTIKQEQLKNYGQYFNANCILVMIGENIFTLSPFLHFITEGHYTKLCFYAQKRGEEPNKKFHFEIIGESRSIEIDQTSFAEEMKRINLLVPAKSTLK